MIGFEETNTTCYTDVRDDVYPIIIQFCWLEVKLWRFENCEVIFTSFSKNNLAGSAGKIFFPDHMLRPDRGAPGEREGYSLKYIK